MPDNPNDEYKWIQQQKNLGEGGHQTGSGPNAEGYKKFQEEQRKKEKRKLIECTKKCLIGNRRKLTERKKN